MTVFFDTSAVMALHIESPLRRLADRYVLRAAHAVANGQPVAAEVSDAFQRLPTVMAKAAARTSDMPWVMPRARHPQTCHRRHWCPPSSQARSLPHSRRRLRLQSPLQKKKIKKR